MEKLKLKNTSLVVLFITSYLPLFGLLVLRQVKQNREYLYFGGINKDAILFFITKFGLSFLLILISLFGLIGVRLLLKNLKRKINNGEIVKILDIENKNNEAIGYISTYIVPFIFQDTNDIFDLTSIIVVLAIIFVIYTKSNMIVINPILNISHSLFQIEYSLNGKKRKGLLITELDEVDEQQELKINQISKNIFYG